MQLKADNDNLRWEFEAYKPRIRSLWV